MAQAKALQITFNEVEHAIRVNLSAYLYAKMPPGVGAARQNLWNIPHPLLATGKGGKANQTGWLLGAIYVHFPNVLP